jgi:hypothetical protein
MKRMLSPEEAGLAMFTDEELKDELVSRVQDREPKLLKTPDFSKLIKACEEVISAGHNDNDFKHSIYEEAMTALYGEDVFDWLNDCMETRYR